MHKVLKDGLIATVSLLFVLFGTIWFLKFIAEYGDKNIKIGEEIGCKKYMGYPIVTSDLKEGSIVKVVAVVDVGGYKYAFLKYSDGDITKDYFFDTKNPRVCILNKNETLEANKLYHVEKKMRTEDGIALKRNTLVQFSFEK